jgi:hypothetical protein
MKIDRQEKKEADPRAAERDAKKCEKKIRSEMNKLLNIADAVDGLIAVEDQRQLERVAKLYLQPIIGEAGDHGHARFGHDRDQDGATKTGDGPTEKSAADPKAADGAIAPQAQARNPWFSLTRKEQAQFAAKCRRASQEKKRAEGDEPQSDLAE